MQQQVVDAERALAFNKEKLKKVFSLDNIVDACVDLFLVLFDVITSPILIIMRMIRWTVGTYILDGLKTKVKKIIHWVKGKPRWVQVIVIPSLLIATALILIFIWIFGQAWGEFVVEEF
jgi:hypothetical protein